MDVVDEQGVGRRWRDRAHSESVRVPALRAARSHLAVAAATAQAGGTRQAETAGERGRERARGIEAATPSATRVRRHGYDGVGDP
jgi:hypothetical protein